jgi:2-polyprenyl-6-methoxyphenol hydroxylase-like FAD-dependent oxidoreductase
MAAALLLARDGHRVMVFERFDEPRPLGSGLMLQPTGLAVLDQLGLATAAIAAGQRIDRLCGKAGNRTVLDVRYSSMRGRLFGVGIHRSALFSLLHDALKSDGAAIATGREVTGVERRSDGIRLLFALGSAEGPFDLAVDALGTRSALSPDVGRELRYGALWTNVNLPRDEFDRHMLSQRYRRASVMAGVLPIGGEQAGFFWSLRAKDHATWLATGLESWKSDVRSLWPATSPLLDQIGSHDDLTFARYAHKTIHRPAGDRLIHIGDSWHSASPQLGQGANMALLDAFALARALREAGSVGDGLAAVVSMRRSHVRLYQLLTALLTPVYQSDSRIIPPARDWLMGPASKIWPMTSFQVALVSGLVGSPLRRLGIDFAPPQTGS